MPKKYTQAELILQTINETISFHDKLYRSDLKELSIPITARHGRSEYSTIILSTKYIADPRDALSELIKIFIQQDLYLMRNESGDYPHGHVEECRKIEKWLSSH